MKLFKPPLLFFCFFIFLLIGILIHVPFTHAKGSCSCADKRESIVENEEGCKTFCGTQGRAYQEIKEGEEKETAIAKFVGFSAAMSIPQLIGLSLRVVLGLMGSIALLLIVWGGFGWLTSGGSPDKIKKAKDTLLWAIIGLIIIFASYALVDILIRTWR